ncbi:MAG: hypothetical protein ACT4OP_09680, partial [Actinomycetota bacterium]
MQNKQPFRNLIGFALTGVLAACGGGASNLENSLKLNDDPNSVLLMVRDVGGFVPVDFMVGQGPRLVLLRDGTLISPGPQIAMYPGPLLPNYQQSILDDETRLFVLEELDSIGFADITDEVNDEASDSVADAPNTVVTFYNQDGAHTLSVYALGLGAPVSDARVGILANLVDRLSQIGFAGGVQPYESDSIQVMAG